VDIFHIDPQITAFIRPSDGANVGLIHTPIGDTLIDSTSSPAEIKALLEAVDIHPGQINLVINTHFHSDHTWGNQLFNCPILAHRLCLERMEFNLRDEWSPAEFQAYLAELMQTDPQKAGELRKTLQELHITLPDRVFEERFDGEIGGVKFQVIHMGGHTPDSAIVWLPEKFVLFASDLIFQGRYPFVFDADIPAWIDALKRLQEYQAEVIIPGHGVRCTAMDIRWLMEYLLSTWQLTEAHIQQGHSLEEACADPRYPIFSEGKKEKLHIANIGYMYGKLRG
jgi:glyoxylase-like metal-dependent hydrolase (beta-lactamase superfamily II)